mmetsp:Transcript_72334/g.154828  ORF Transcript_72334/g.154828 Transcript_72334/m.154828 type:complete len:208 (+) Transcript_72334:255-878(+)
MAWPSRCNALAEASSFLRKSSSWAARLALASARCCSKRGSHSAFCHRCSSSEYTTCDIWSSRAAAGPKALDPRHLAASAADAAAASAAAASAAAAAAAASARAFSSRSASLRLRTCSFHHRSVPGWSLLSCSSIAAIRSCAAACRLPACSCCRAHAMVRGSPAAATTSFGIDANCFEVSASKPWRKLSRSPWSVAGAAASEGMVPAA